MINKIGKITLYVNNQEEAKKFWTEKLNFIVKFEQQMGPNMKWIEIAPSQDEFTTFILYDKKMMATQNPHTNTGHPSIILSSSNLEKTHTEFKAKGINVSTINKMPYGSMFNFTDMDGNIFLVREDIY